MNKKKAPAKIDFSKYNKKIKQIKKLHFSAMKKSIEAFNHAVEIGGILKEIRDDLPYGYFTNFLKENFAYASDRTARRYMQFHDRQDDLRKALGELLDISSATKYLESLNLKGRKELPKKTVETIQNFKKEYNKSLKLAMKKKDPALLTEDEKETLIQSKQKSFKTTVKALLNRIEEIDFLDIDDEKLQPAIGELEDILEQLKEKRMAKNGQTKNENNQ